jgi:phospholipid transport system substrate-binding protein
VSRSLLNLLAGLLLSIGTTLYAAEATLAAVAPVAEDPFNLVRETADRVLAEISSRKEELTESPGKIYGLVDDIVLPKFDFYRMSRLVLGKYWRRATDPEQASFIREFRELLVRTPRPKQSN